MAETDALILPLSKGQETSDPFVVRRPYFGGPRQPFLGIIIALLTMVGLIALILLAAKPITARLIEDGLAKQGVHAKVEISHLSFDSARGRIRAYEKKSQLASQRGLKKPGFQPEFQIDRFDIRYRADLFAREASKRLVIKSVQVRGLDLALSQKQNRLHFQAIDPLIQAQLKAQSGGIIDLIVIEDARLKLFSPMGLVQAQGGVSIEKGSLATLTLKMLPVVLDGPNGQAKLIDGQLRARRAEGNKINIDARLVGEMVYLSSTPDPLAPVQGDGGAVASLLGAQDFVIQASGALPATWESLLNKHNSQQIIAPKGGSGPLEMRFAIRAKGLQTEAVELFDLEAQSHWRGSIKAETQTVNSIYSWDAGAHISGRAGRVSYQNSDGNTLGFIINISQIKAQIAALGANGFQFLSLKALGEMRSDLSALRLDDLYASQSELALKSWDLELSPDQVRLRYLGSMNAAKLGLKDLALSQMTGQIEGSFINDYNGQDQSLSHDIGLSIYSPDGRYTGLREIAAGLEAAQLVLPAEVEETRLPDGKNQPDHAPLNGPDGIIALDRAFERFSLRAKGVRISQRSLNQSPPQLRIGLQGMIVADFSDGGRLNISPRGDVVLVTSQARNEDGLSLNLSGPSLPVIAMDIGAFELGDMVSSPMKGWFSAAAEGDIANIQGLNLSAKGRFTHDQVNGLRVETPTGILVSARQAQIGETVDNLKTRLIANGGPLVSFNMAGLALRARFVDLSVQIKAPGIDLVGLNGALSYNSTNVGNRPGYVATIGVDSGLIKDALSGPARFVDLNLFGRLSLTQEKGGGEFYLTDSKSPASSTKTAWVKLGITSFDQNRAGKVLIETPTFVFTNQFTPSDISPLLATIAPREAKGTARFDGNMQWGVRNKKTYQSSDGVLQLDRVGFAAPTHKVDNLSVRLVFDSLAPLNTLTSQPVLIDQMILGVPLKDLKLSLSVDKDVVSIADAHAQTSGGLIHLDAFFVDLTKKSDIKSRLWFDKLALGPLLKETGLRDSVRFEGLIDASLPLGLINDRFVINNGTIINNGPGRLMISRTAVTGISGGEGGALPDTQSQVIAAVPNAEMALGPSDLAFQAMEHIAFNELEGRLQSLDDGRLSMNFSIKGQFDPPTKQQTKVSLWDLITGRWTNKPVKLQSGAPIDLTLDVPLNLDDLLKDLGQLNQNSKDNRTTETLSPPAQ
jgi:hypothetical protein